MVSKQLEKRWAEHRRQREEEERQSRVMVITEFDAGDPEATMHALAAEILRYRQALRLLLPLAFVTLGLMAPMASVAAQPFTQGAAARAISAANALSARIRGYHRWQGLTPSPASYCATMREGEAVLKELSRLASRAILYRAPGLALSLQQAGDRLSDELDEEEQTNQQAGMPWTLYPCPVPAPYPPRALVLRIVAAKAPACRKRADALRVSFAARRALMQRCLRIPA